LPKHNVKYIEILYCRLVTGHFKKLWQNLLFSKNLQNSAGNSTPDPKLKGIMLELELDHIKKRLN